MKNFSKGFTLSEVLITLVVIGVVSAMTIPFCVAAYRENIKKVQIKKYYKEINEAIESAQNESFQSQTASFKSYLNIKEECGFNVGCAAQTIYKDENGDIKAGNDFYNSQLYEKSILSDGSFLIVNNGINHDKSGDEYSITHPNEFCVFHTYIDINGENGPNQICKDTFPFCIMQSGRMEPDKHITCTKKYLSEN